MKENTAFKTEILKMVYNVYRKINSCYLFYFYYNFSTVECRTSDSSSSDTSITFYEHTITKIIDDWEIWYAPGAMLSLVGKYS